MKWFKEFACCVLTVYLLSNSILNPNWICSTALLLRYSTKAIARRWISDLILVVNCKGHVHQTFLALAFGVIAAKHKLRLSLFRKSSFFPTRILHF